RDLAFALLVADLAARAIAASEPLLEVAHPDALALWAAGRRGGFLRFRLVRAYERFDLAHAEALLHRLLREADERRFVADAEQRAGVAFAEPPVDDHLAHLLGQLQEPQRIGDRRAVFVQRGRE